MYLCMHTDHRIKNTSSKYNEFSIFLEPSELFRGTERYAEEPSVITYIFGI